MTPQEAVEQLIHETECLRAENAQLRGELTEARKQPVRLLPTVTTQMIDEACDAPMPLVQAMNTVLARHFCEAAEARLKPALDVEAVAKEINEKWLYDSQLMITVREAAVHVLRAHVTDAPAQPLQETQQLDDETLAAAVARVERETRRECAAMVRELSETTSAQALGISARGLKRFADRMERGE